MSIRLARLYDVLEAAKDAADARLISACRRLIVANRRGWSQHAQRADIELVWAFA